MCTARESNSFTETSVGAVERNSTRQLESGNNSSNAPQNNIYVESGCTRNDHQYESKEMIDASRRPEAITFGEKFVRSFRKVLHKGTQNVKRRNIQRNDVTKHNANATTNIASEIINDLTKGDQKILRAIGRTATVNAAVLLTALTGGSTGAAAGFLTGGAITAKRLGDGVVNEDEKEVAKSLAVYGSATVASVTGQAVTGVLMVGVLGASLPVAGAVAFGIGCASGITAGALSEWGVDNVLDDRKQSSLMDETINDEELLCVGNRAEVDCANDCRA